MKFTSLALAALGVCAILAQVTTAQVVRPVPGPDFYVAMDDTAPSPSDLVIPAAPAETKDVNLEKQYDCGDGSVPCPKMSGAKQNRGEIFGGGKDSLQLGSDCSCGGLKGCDKCCDVEAWELMSRTPRGWKVGGWLQAGYHTEGANGFGTGMFNNYPNKVQMQQAWIYAEKEADTGGCGWDWGFRMDYVYGTDGPNTQAFGNQPGRWDEGWDNGGAYGHAIPQAYGEIAYNNLSIKVGHFFTICGYEVVGAPGNFFYSHAYTMNQAEPFTHTGALADWAATDRLTLWGGWTRGWDTGFNDNGGSTFLGGFSYDLTDRATFIATSTMGDFGGGGNSDSNGYSHSAIFDWQLTKRLNYVLQTDYVDNDVFIASQLNNLAAGFPGPPVLTPDQHTMSVNQYLIYTLNDCWAFGGRFEWFRWGGYEMNEVTVGANWRPHKNLVVRPEVRTDFFESGVKAATGLKDSTTFGIDAIVTF